ncbi:MAG: type II secretion system F family protein [Terracidiphilus sp.]|nr:type II secretion system F family protein [Terracidiphilus sp.]
MLLILILVFLGVFAVAALLMVASGTLASQKARQVLATLDSVLATDTPEAKEQVVNLRKNERFSAIPWINRELQKLELAPRLHRLLAQADLKWTAGGLLAMCTAGAVIPFYLIEARTGLLLAAVPCGLAVGAAPVAWVFFKRNKRFGKFEEGLPEALDLMVSALRAGHSLIAAMGLVARECVDPIGAEFRACFEEQNYGLEMNTAMDNMINRVPLQDLRIVSTAIMIQRESGGNLAEVLDKTSHVIRERFRLKRQVMTHTAQGRLTGIILTVLPVVLGIAIYFVNPEMMSILWKTQIGIKLLWAASGMIVIGGLIIRKIVNMDV